MNFNNNLQLFKNHYDKNGWVLLKNFVTVEKVNQIKLIIRDYIEDQIKKINNPRKLNFTDNQLNIKSLNSFHDLGNNKQIKRISNSKKIKDIVKFFLNSEPEYRQSELFANPNKN